MIALSQKEQVVLTVQKHGIALTPATSSPFARKGGTNATHGDCTTGHKFRGVEIGDSANFFIGPIKVSGDAGFQKHISTLKTRMDMETNLEWGQYECRFVSRGIFKTESRWTKPNLKGSV
jgi:hypothetical protein